MNLLAAAQKLMDICREDRRRLHMMAETGFDLQQTREFVMRRLAEMDLQAEECGKCGVVCSLGSGDKTILLRADMDALPIREESHLDFACENGCMHACGHDMHTAMLLCAAQMLKKHEDSLKCRVKLAFQPAEEILMGAQDMMDAGMLSGVDAAAMLHVLVGQEVPVGTVIIAPAGESAPAAGFFTIEVIGSGGHGAMSLDSVDPLNAAAHIVLALQAVPARELGLNDSAALTIGAFKAGSAANVIPQRAVLKGSFRAYGDAVMDFMRRRIVEIARDTASAFRAQAEVRFEGRCPSLWNDEGMCRLARKALGDHLLPVLDGRELGGRASGSEDFANISRKVPSVMLALAAGRPGDGHGHPLHHPAVTFDESALPYGAAAYAALALAFGENGNAPG